MRTKNIMLFAYDFPHKKTQDFLFRLIIEKYNIKYVIAAPRIKLNIPESPQRITPINEGLIHPRTICEYFQIPYFVSGHNEEKAINIINKYPVDLYIIAGARILKKNVISAAKNRVINVHPGLLPEVRGLDTILWSIIENKPIGISVHFISTKMDLGRLVCKEKLELRQDDDIKDVSLRLLEKQTDVLIKGLNLLRKMTLKELNKNELKSNNYHSKMSQKLEKQALGNFNEWLKSNTG